MKNLFYLLIIGSLFFVAIGSHANDNNITDIKKEILNIKSFQKYKIDVLQKDYYYLPNILILGWLKNNKIAYIVADAILSEMSGGFCGNVFVLNTIDNKIMDKKELYDDSLSVDEIALIYKKNKREIDQILRKYNIVINNNVQISKKNNESLLIERYKIKQKKYIKFIIKEGSTIVATTSMEEFPDNEILDFYLFGKVQSPYNKAKVFIIAFIQKNGSEGNSVEFKVVGN